MIGARVGFFSPQSTTHPEAADWASRVTAAGGTYSAATLAAVSKFCNDIDGYGLRSKFLRLSLLCGDNLTACLIPLYRNTSSTGSAIGNSSDTNNNFVSGDFVETGSSTGGLKGNGSTKYLATGVSPSTTSATSSDFHLCIYAKGVEATGTTRAYIGSQLATTPELYLGITGGGSTETGGISVDSVTRLTAPTGTKEGMMAIVCNGSRTQTYYLNGATSTNTGPSTGLPSAGIDVFRASTFYALAKYMRGYSVGLGMSSTEMANYRTAIETFNTSLSRKV